MNQTQPTWQEIKKANSFGESVNLANRRYKIGNLPHDGGKLSCVDPIWTKENASSVGECIKEGVGYGLKASVIPAALFGISALATGGTSLAAGVFGVGSVYVANKLIGAMATRHKRDGWLLENPEPKKEPVKAPEMPVDMDDGNGKWWGQDVQDALDAHFTKFTEVTNMVDSVEGVKVPVTSIKTDRMVHVVAMTEALNVFLFELEARKGFDPKSINKVSESLNLSLKVKKGFSISVDNNIGNGRIGLYVPKEIRGSVPFSKMLPELSKSKAKLPWVLCQSVSGKNIIIDLEEAPHFKMQGTTKSGKSVAVQAGVIGLAAKLPPSALRLWFADPKVSSLPMMESLDHVECMSETADEFLMHLDRLVDIYNERKELWKKLRKQDAGDLEAAGYDMPYHIIIIEEASGLVSETKTPIPEGLDENGKEVKPKTTYEEECKARIIQLVNKGRAARIHIVFVSQYMARSVFPPTVMANITTGISFKVDADSDSVMVLGESGAESLLGRGDGYVKSSEFPSPERFQGAFLTTDQIESSVAKINKKWRKNNAA